MSWIDYSGRSILITGASGGIGRGLALAFGACHGTVIVHYHSNTARAEELVNELQSNGVSCFAVQADLSDEIAVAAMFRDITNRCQKLDVCINNAGSYLYFNQISEMTLDEWKKLLDLNLNSVFCCTQAAARLMKQNPDGGAIVNIASIEALIPIMGHSYYNVAKAGLEMFTRSAAQEFGADQIRVNSVSPGLIWKDGLDQEWPAGVKLWLEHTPLGFIGSVEDVANACLFLSSSLAKWITGANLVVDGGFSVRDIYR